MKTIEEVRRENLRILARELGGIRSLAEQLQRSESQVSGWANGVKDSKTGRRRGMSATSCRDVERKAGKPPNWMDVPSDTPESPERARAHEIIDNLPDDQVDRFLAALEAMAKLLDK